MSYLFHIHAKAFFCTPKYRPGYSAKGLLRQDATRQWVRKFVSWYNLKHRHSAIKFVTPAQRHGGEEVAFPFDRDGLYRPAKAARWV